MKRRLRNAFTGFGSALNIFPYSDYRKYIDQRTPEERMRSHFEHTGQSLHRALNQFGEEQEKHQ